MRILNRIVLTVGLALTVASQAGAVTISLVQIGGTYDGISAVAGDTLTLEIEVTLGPADAVTLVDPAITFGAEVAAALPGGGPFGACPSALACEASFNFVNGVLLAPIGAAGADIGIAAAGQLDGWEGQTLNPAGAPGPATFSLGQATFTLSGASGTIAVGAVGLPFGTVIGGAGFVDITGVSTLGSFTVLAPDCEAEITKIARPGSVTLRNSSTGGAQTGGSTSVKSVTAVVTLKNSCGSTRDVTVTLSVTDVDGDPVSVSPSSITKNDVNGGRFKFTMTNTPTSCADDEGPVPKSDGGTNQVNVDGLTYNATVTNSDAGGADPGPNGSSFGPVNSDLTCKPSRSF